MYNISNIKTFINKERRHDELDRLGEVRKQKKVWWNVVIACGTMNVILLILSIIGYINNG